MFICCGSGLKCTMPCRSWLRLHISIENIFNFNRVYHGMVWSPSRRKTKKCSLTNTQNSSYMSVEAGTLYVKGTRKEAEIYAISRTCCIADNSSAACNRLTCKCLFQLQARYVIRYEFTKAYNM